MAFFWDRGGESKNLERIIALEKANETLDSRLRLLKNEWEDVLDRVNRVMGRLNARIRKFNASESPESDELEPPKGVDPPRIGTGTHATLRAARERHGILPR